MQREALEALAGAAALHEAIAGAQPEAADLLRRLAVLDDADGLDPDGTLIELVRAAGGRMLRELEGRARQAADDTASLGEIVADSSWLKAELETLRDPPEFSPLPSAALGAAHRILERLHLLRGTPSTP